MCVYLNTLRQKFGLLSNLIEAKTKYMGLDLSCKSWNMEQFFFDNPSRTKSEA